MSSDSAGKKTGAPTAGSGLEAASERKYLTWYNKVGYGSGDVAGNVVYVLLSAFVMIYLTDTAGLNAGVVGTLMMVSRLFDGFSDIIFGALLDRTNTRMGKARPWMLWGFVGCAVLLIAIFAIPTSLGDTAKYAWFFIAYTLLNAVFFTANNIAYSSLTALITRNGAERVQMGSIRFMFAFGTNLLIQSATVGGVALFGGGASGWRTMAILYALLGLAVNTLSVFSVKELPPEELELPEVRPELPCEPLPCCFLVPEELDEEEEEPPFSVRLPPSFFSPLVPPLSECSSDEPGDSSEFWCSFSSSFFLSLLFPPLTTLMSPGATEPEGLAEALGEAMVMVPGETLALASFWAGAFCVWLVSLEPHPLNVNAHSSAVEQMRVRAESFITLPPVR